MSSSVHRDGIGFTPRNDREVFFEWMRDDGIGVPLPMDDTVKRHSPDLTGSGLRAT